MTRSLLALVCALLAVAAFLVLRWSGAGTTAGAAASADGTDGADEASAPSSPAAEEAPADLTTAAGSAEPDREALAPADGSDSPLEGTQVVVRVLDAETGQPTAGASVSLSTSGSARRAEGAVGELGRSLTSGADGRVWFLARADVALRGRVRSEAHQALRYEVEPLAEGEVRERELSLARHVETPMHYRLVDAQSGAPITGAAAHATTGRPNLFGPGADDEDTFSVWGPGGDSVAMSDADGLLVLPHDTSAASAAYDLFAHGYGPHRLIPTADWDDPAAPREVTLQRAARLTFDATSRPEADELDSGDVLLLVDDSALERLTIGAQGRMWRPLRMPVRSAGAPGLFEAEGLPPDVELRLEARQGGDVVYEHEERLSLAPGEHRTVAWAVPTAAELTGLVVRSGAPMPNESVQLLQARPGADRAFLSGREESVVRTRTDGDGAFRFEAVPPGTYWLCAAAAGATETAQAVRVRVPGADVVLELVGDATIEGRVSAADEPVPGARLLAFEEGTEGSLEATTDDAGAFTLQVADRGRWRIVAMPPGRSYGSLASTVVEGVAPGTRDLAIALGRAKTIHVRATDADGRPLDAWIDLVGPDGRGGAIAGAPREEMSFQGHPAGEYVVFAHTNSGLAGIQRHTLEEDGEDEVTVTVPLTAGARVRVTGDDVPPNASVLLRRDGTIHARLSRLDGTLATFTVPPGTYRVECRESFGARTVDLGTHTFPAGQETELPYSD